MKSLVLLSVLASLFNLNLYAQSKTKKIIVKKPVQTKVIKKKIIKKKKIVKKYRKVRIFRSPLDLLYIPKRRQFMLSAGLESSNHNYLNDFLVPQIITLGQNPQVFSEEIDEKKTRGFIGVDFGLTKNFIVGARFANSFVNTIESAGARNGGTSFTLFDEENPGFEDPEVHALFRIARQKKIGFTIDLLASVTVGVQDAQKEEGDFDVNIPTYRGNFVPNESFTQQGNPANGGTDIKLGVRAGRKHSPKFEYSLEADFTYKTKRDYEVLRAYSQTVGLFTDLEYQEDAHFSAHIGATAQFTVGDMTALYVGADFVFTDERQLNTTYPNTAVENVDWDAQSGFGARLGVKFLVLPKRMTINLEGHFLTFADFDVITTVNDIESHRYQTTDNTIIGGKLQANFFF